MDEQEIAAMVERYATYDQAFLRLWEQTGAAVAASEAGNADYVLEEV